MKILVACEESQAVKKELRALGHEAYSCEFATKQQRKRLNGKAVRVTVGN